MCQQTNSDRIRHINSLCIALRYSQRGYIQNGAITNIPLYLATKTKELLCMSQVVNVNFKLDADVKKTWSKFVQNWGFL